MSDSLDRAAERPWAGADTRELQLRIEAGEAEKTIAFAMRRGPALVVKKLAEHGIRPPRSTSLRKVEMAKLALRRLLQGWAR